MGKVIRGHKYEATYAEMESVARTFCKEAGISHEGMNAVDAIECEITRTDADQPTMRRNRQLRASWEKICRSRGWIA